MATAAEMAASAAWLAKEHPDWNQQATSASQAAQINAAYLANQLPVLPQYAVGGGAKYTAEQIADAAAETAKHMEAFHPEQYYGVSPAALGGMTQSEIASRYGPRMAEHVSSYYYQHPSERYLATTAQYEAQRNRVVSVGAGGEASTYQAGVGWVSTPTDKGTAAAQIAREVGITGGAVDVRLGMKAIAEGAKPSEVYFATGTYLTRPTFQSELLTTKEGQHFVNQAWTGAPIRANVAASELAAGTFRGSLEMGIHTAPGDWGGLYTTEATKAETTPTAPLTIRGEKIVAGLAETNYTVVSDQKQIKNAVTTYVPYGSYTQEELQNTRLAIDKKTGEVAIYQYNPQRDQWSLIGGGGRNALQSGMFSVVKPLTAFVTTQEGVGTYIRPEGAGVSRLGAEATGGAVRPLSEVKALAPSEAFSRYFGTYGKYNLANFVDQVAAGKAEEPGARIPWTLPSESPAIQYMGPEGIVRGKAVTDVTGRTIESILGASATGRLVGSKMVGGEATISEVVPVVPSELPAPYISASTGTIAPKGDLFGVMLPFGLSNVVAFFQPGKEITVQPKMAILPTTTTQVGEVTTTLPESRVLKGTEVTYDAAGNEITTKTYEVTGGTETTKQYVTTGGKTVTTTTFEKSTPSEWDKWLTGAEKTTADVTGISKAYVPSAKEIQSYAPYYAGWLPPVHAALSFGPTSEYAASFIHGEAAQMKEKPLESAISYGIAYVGGGLWRGAEIGMAASRASFAEKAISQGGVWRGAEIAATYALPVAGAALTGLYGISVGERVTAGGKDFSPAAAERAGGLAVGEVIPGLLGFTSGYKAPETAGFIYRSAVATPGKVSEAIYGFQQRSMGIERISGEKPSYEYTVTPITSPKGPSAPDIGEMRMMEVYGTTAPRATSAARFADIVTPPSTAKATVDIGEARLREVYGTTEPRFVERATKEFARERAYDIFIKAETAPTKATVDLGEAGLAEASRVPYSWEQRVKLEETTAANLDYINSIIKGETAAKVPQVKPEMIAEEKSPYDLSRLTYATKEPKTIEIPTAYDWNVARQMTGVSAPTTAITPKYAEARPYWEIPTELEVAGRSERSMADTFVTMATGTYRISQAPSRYIPDVGKLPAISEDMFTYGSAMDIGARRIIATSEETGMIVGATAYETRAGELFIKTMGSRQAGIGTAMTKKLKDIALQERVSIISGESRPAAVGFWEKMGAEIKAPTIAKTTVPFEMRIREPQEVSQVRAFSSLGFTSAIGIATIGKTTVVTPTSNIWRNIIGSPTQEIKTTQVVRQEIKPVTEQKQEPYKDVWKEPVIDTIKVPGSGADLRSSAAGGGGGAVGGFKFTDVLQVKGAREVMFGKTPTKRRKTFKLI